MNAYDEDRIQHLLKQALPPVAAEAESERDLWPAVLHRFDAHPATPSRFTSAWFDWAVLAGLGLMAVSFPASIPLLLYYL